MLVSACLAAGTAVTVIQDRIAERQSRLEAQAVTQGQPAFALPAPIRRGQPSLGSPTAESPRVALVDSESRP